MNISGLEGCSIARVRNLQDRLRRRVQNARTLDVAAQSLSVLLAEEFHGAVALTRVFATMQYQALPQVNRAFVDRLARSANVESLMKPTTRVLSLFGTTGAMPEWNDRTRSEGRIGIPLVSAEFVESIPMVSALLSELGATPTWVNQREGGVQVDQLLGGEAAAVFHIADAQTATDARGRKIIPSQDFVAAHGIRTVFGMGGHWPNGDLVAAIMFSRANVDRVTVRRYAPLLSVFRAGTTALVMNGQYFA